MNSPAIKYEQRSLRLEDLISAGSPEELAGKYGIILPPNILSAAEKRAYEYLGGRICASEALRAVGCSTIGALLSSDNRIIDWPAGYQASISHSAGFVTAVAIKNSDISSIGVDLELVMPIDRAIKLASRLLTNEEMHGGINPTDQTSLETTLIFSAKESIFKCLYPVVRVYFGFKDASCIQIDYSKSTMTFKLNRRLSEGFDLNHRLCVSFKLKDNLVETLCWLKG